jgi:hypothetical protein
MEVRFQRYRRIGWIECRPYQPGENLSGVSVSDPDKETLASDGGMIARNPDKHEDQWFIARDFFEKHYEQF